MHPTLTLSWELQLSWSYLSLGISLETHRSFTEFQHLTSFTIESLNQIRFRNDFNHWSNYRGTCRRRAKNLREGRVLVGHWLKALGCTPPSSGKLSYPWTSDWRGAGAGWRCSFQIHGSTHCRSQQRREMGSQWISLILSTTYVGIPWRIAARSFLCWRIICKWSVALWLWPLCRPPIFCMTYAQAFFRAS